MDVLSTLVVLRSAHLPAGALDTSMVEMSVAKTNTLELLKRTVWSVNILVLRAIRSLHAQG